MALKQLGRYFLKYPFHLLGGVLFVVLSNVFSLAPARYTRETIDFLEHKSTRTSFWGIETAGFEWWQVLLVFFGIMLVATLLKGLFMFFMRQTIIVMSRNIEYDLKNDLFQKLLHLPASFYKLNRTGDLMSRISEDVGQVRMFAGPAVMYSVNLIVMFILVFSSMIRIDETLTFFVLLPLPLLSVLIFSVSQKINRLSTVIQTRLGQLSSFAQSSFSGIRVIKAFGFEAQNAAMMEAESDQLKAATLRLTRVETLFAPSIVFLVGLSSLFTIYVGGLRYAKEAITLGNIAEFIIYLNMLIWPVTALGWVSSLTQKANASMTRLNQVLDEPERKQGSELALPVPGEPAFEFKRVAFTYPENGILALSDVSFSIQAGETTGITGKTGSGKSSIVSLMLGHYQPDRGNVLFFGKPIESLNRASYLSKIAWVGQDIFLFSDTLRNNILFGASERMVTEQDILEAIQLSSLGETITSFPDGLETRLGERGITLSGGQRQRLALARALVRKPEVLILDDTFSALDPLTEKKILTAINNQLSHCTVILISHRKSTLINCQQIISIEGGTVI